MVGYKKAAGLGGNWRRGRRTSDTRFKATLFKSFCTALSYGPFQ